MAITIINQPDDYTPIHSPMMYLLSSTLSGNDNMKVKFRVDVNAEVRNILVSPRPDGLIEFDISSHLRDFLNLDDFNPTKILISNTDVSSFVDYETSLIEQYTDANGDIIYGSSVRLDEITATNIVLDRSEYINFDIDRWKNDTDTTPSGIPKSNVMLNSNTNSNYYTDDTIWIHTVGLGSGSQRRFNLKQYDINGVSLTSTLTNVMNGSDKCQFYKLDLSNLPITIDPLTVKIGVYFSDDLSERLTLENKYNLKEPICLPYQNFKLVYLDKLGSYNTINLGYKSEEDLKIDKENFRKRIDPINGTDYSRGLKTNFVKANETYTLNTDNLNEADLLRFEDMMLSTDVYLDVSSFPYDDRENTYYKYADMNYVPLIIKTDSLRRYKSENQDLAQYTVKCELGYELNLRRR